MLKETWRQSSRSQSTQADEQEGAAFVLIGNLTVDTMEAVDASSDSSEPETGLASMLRPVSARLKRPRSNGDVDGTWDSMFPFERPAKHPRADSDQLRNHLSELVEPSHDHAYMSLPIEALREQILGQAKCTNSIAFLPDLNSVENILYDYLAWVVEDEGHRMSSSSAKRVALLVEEKEESMAAHIERMKDLFPQIATSIYFGDDPKADSQTWAELLHRDIVITSSQRLVTSLSRGLLEISQIHSLLLGDAQVILNQDSHQSMPIVQVMNGFYHVAQSSSRPRIFAIAKMPRHLYKRFDSKMLKLETILAAQVFGVAGENRAKIQELPDRPDEVVVLYDNRSKERLVETRLFQQLHTLDPEEKVIRRHLRAARRALEEVGSCASDLTWRRALKDIEMGLPLWYEDDEDEDTPTSPQQIRLHLRDMLKNWIFTMPNLNPSSRGFNVTYKFLRLVQILESCEAYGEGFRGIIFTQRRATALVLAELLRTLDDRLSFIRSYAVCGHNLSAEATSVQEIFDNFATGVYNLLIATRCIEELDVPKASIVIRYDLFNSPLSHAFSRACTRGRESHLVHLAERGNDFHKSTLLNLNSLDSDMLRWTEEFAHSLSTYLPPASLKEPSEPYRSDSEDDENEKEVQADCIVDPTTGGRIYLQDATTVLFRYVARLRREEYALPSSKHSLFQFRDAQKDSTLQRHYICTISLPGTPIDNVSGTPAFSKALARRSACHAACKQLSTMGCLDHRIVPIPSILPSLRHPLNSPEITNEPKVAGTRRYPRKLPDFWKFAGAGRITRLYPTIIFAEPTSGNERYAPIAILTRQPLPEMPEVNLYQSGVPIRIHFYGALSMEPNEETLQKMYDFTNRMFRSSLNKPLACPIENVTYLLVPLQLSWQPHTVDGFKLPSISDHISWELVLQPAGKWATPINNNSLDEMECDLEDAVVQDRWLEFTRRYNVVKLRRDLNPLSKPSDSIREAEYDNLLAYVSTKRETFTGLKDDRQPIIEVEKVPTLLSHLNPNNRGLTPPSRASAKYLIPELCAKFILPMSVLRTALLIPSVMWKVDDLLVVKELNAKFFDHAVREDLLYASICAPSAGLEHNYERLELLGDAFLKYLSTVHVFVNNPTQNEGSLHIARQKLISNKSLFQFSCQVGLPPFIRSKLFHTKSWRPPNYTLVPLVAKSREKKSESEADGSDRDGGVTSSKKVSSESLDARPEIEGLNTSPLEVDVKVVKLGIEQSDSKLEEGPAVDLQKTQSSSNQKQKQKMKKDELNWQTLGDKAIADVAEAIIGAAYISGGRETSLQVVKALTIPVFDIHTWSDFGSKVLIPLPSTIAQLHPGSIQAVENIIGHKFQRPHLLAQAMTHSSMHGNEMLSYERLEFVGDAILDFMVVRHIYDRYQTLSPGGLTLLKSAMVSNTALASVCVSSGLQDYLLFESYQLSSSIREYATLIKAKEAEEHAFAKRENRPPGQYWLDIEPPKALSDVVESIIGAVYISDNFSPTGAEAFFDNVLKPFFDKHITLQTLSHHPTKTLFELIQAHGCQSFKIIKDARKKGELITCHVMIHDTKLSSASDSTPTFAARRASVLALDALKEDSGVISMKCDCKARTQSKNAWPEKGFEHVLSSLIEGGDDIDTDSVQTHLRSEAPRDLLPSDGMKVE